MPAISVGSVEVDVLPNARGIQSRLRAALVPPASTIGDEAGRIIGQRIAANIAPAVRDGIQNGARAARPAATRGGEQAGGAFARSLRARLEAAFRSMPRLDVRLSDTGIDADLARLRARLEALAGKTVGIDIDAATARAQAADIEERLRRIGAAHPNVAVRADTAAAIAQLQLLQQQIDETTRDPARIRVETDGQLGARLRAAVKQAEASLPNVNITADSTPAQVEIARLRAQMTALTDARIGIDIDAATAMARLEEVQTRLQRLSASDADVAVRVDAGAASAQLLAFQAQVNRLDGRRVRVDVDTGVAQVALGNLAFAAVALGPALLPILPVAAAGLGAIAAAATAAAVGIGGIALVAVPAFMQMGKVMQAQKAAQDAATNATLKGGQASGQGAQRALQMASAQQSLASAHRNAARQIRQAEQGVADAVRNAAEANERAADQVKQAKRGLADAVQQAADRQRSSAEQIRSAEESLADAQRSARQAQEDLTQARAEAARQLEDLQSRLANAQLSERDAVLGVEEARLRLQRVQQAGAQVSLLDQQRAQLAYDQAVQRLEDQRAETKELTAEKKKADKAGVEGSALVLDAQERLREAEQGVAKGQQQLAKAREDAARQAVQSQRDIAEAQQRVAESQRNVTRTQEDGARSVARAQEQLAAAQQSAADSISSAQRQIASASLSAAGGVDQAAIAQAKYQAELAKLTPSARETLRAFVGLKDAFGAWSRSLQPAVMPIFTRALNGLKNSLPGLTPFVREAADAIKGLQDRASAGFKSPWWKGFKTDLQGSIKPAIEGLGVSFGNVFKGMAGVLRAFFPHMDGISSRMQGITKRFANWGTNLKGSPEFERFLSYASEHGPILAETFRQIGSAFMNVGQALSPISGPLLKLIGGVAEFIAVVADKAPWYIMLLYGIVIATKLWTLAMAALNFVMTANPFVLLGMSILAIIAVVIYAYNRFGWFRAGVQAVWNGIKVGALFLWNSVLKPAFNGIMAGLRAVGGWAMWLWSTAIKPAFDGIVFVGKILLTALVTLVLLPIVAVIKIVGAIAMWLWTTAIKPAFEAIGALAMWLWTTAFRPAFQWIGDKAKWLWNNAIKPAWNGIVAGAKWMWENVLRPVFRFIWEGMKEVGRWAKWLWQNAIKPAWNGIVSAGKWAWENGIKPIFDRFKSIVKGLKGAFDTAVGGIRTAWDKIKSISRKPVQFVVDTVYNKGIVAVWNKVAGAFGAPKLKEYKFASGGIMPGYTPGRDVHQFMSPTGGRLELSGGEAIMRPEFTRAVGSGFVGTMNRIAKSGGAQGVKAALAPLLGGNPNTSTDTSLRYASGGTYPVQSFADGGIFGWIKDKASAAFGAGSAAWNKVKEGASWLKDTLEASARAGVKNVVDPLLAKFPGADTGFGKMIRRIPTKIIDALFGYSKEADKRGAGGIGGPRIAAATKWAKTQHGKRYQWGGNGNPSWDCSGFMSAIESVIRGQKPHRRWSTHAFKGGTPPGWVKNGQSAFRVGITHAGVGHTAGTIGKTDVESRGGDGVVVGSRARGYNDRLFTSWYGFQPGKYDSGGYLQPGLNLAYNGTGRPEPVFTTAQANALTSLASRSGATGAASFEGDLYLDSGEFLGKVRGEAQQVVMERDRMVMAAGRGGRRL
ncbi:hypothetical protein ACF09Y_22045 [Streptomyces massasporeus]|uniref:hypothetical protein n=1 Tax=Streptomyces massasporeus TaxID=67324 RepID=UPI0036F6B615